MEENNLLIFKKSYDFYKTFYELRKNVSKQDRYAIWQRCDDSFLYILESIFTASLLIKAEKLELLKNTSSRLNFFKIMIRLLKDIKSIPEKKYILLEENLYEIGKMLGGWIKFLEK